MVLCMFYMGVYGFMQVVCMFNVVLYRFYVSFILLHVGSTWLYMVSCRFYMVLYGLM